MKVGMLTGSVSRQGGGVFDSIRGLSLALRDHEGIDVHVFGLTDEATEVDLPAWRGLPVHTARIFGLRAFGYAPQLFRSVNDANPDILHVACTWMYPSLVSLRWAKHTGGPVVISPRGDLDPWALANSRWKKQIAAALFERRHLLRAACLHALNEAEAKAFRDYGLANPICIIPNGVDLPDLSSDPRILPAWTSQLPEGGRVLLFLGRLHHKKNIAALIEGWSAAVRDSDGGGDWWLAIAGWDQLGYEARLREMVTTSGAPRVLFLGAQYGEAKDACFRNASAFVLPSLSEGSPRAVLEAWSYGLPVLMTPACNLPEGVRRGAAIACGQSAMGIAQGLQHLFNMSDVERSRMGWAGRRLVEDQFTWARVGRSMMELYRHLLGDGPAPSRFLRRGEDLPAASE